MECQSSDKTYKINLLNTAAHEKPNVEIRWCINEREKTSYIQ